MTRQALSRDGILLAAMQLADRDGIDALTMRALGKSLGVQAMSLYRHVADKDDVLNGLIELVVAEIVLPPDTAHWKVAMRERAHAARQVLLRHPWAASLMTSRPDPGPLRLAYLDRSYGFLVRAGFDLETVDHALNALDSHIYGFTLQELNFPFDWGEVRAVASGFLPQIRAAGHGHVAQLIEHVVVSDYGGVNDFDFGLNLLLDGLERTLRREQGVG